MKTFIRIFFALLLFISSLLVAGSLTAQNLITSDLSEVAYQQVDIGERLVSNISVASIFIEEENREQFLEIANKIRTSEQLDKLVDTYADTFIDDLLQDDETKRSQHNQDINEDAKNFVLSFAPEIKSILPDSLNDEQKQSLIDESLSQIDFNTYYNDALATTKSSVSESNVTLLRFGVTLSQPIVFMISIILMIASLLILIILDVKDKTWGKAIGVALSLSGFILLITRLIAPIMLNQIMSRLALDSSTFGDAALQLLLIFGIAYFVSGLVSFIVSVRLTNTD